MRPTVDKSKGVIFGATVAQAGTIAKGHSEWIDEGGAIVKSGTAGAKKYALKVDQKTLETALSLIQPEENIRTRVNHSDSVNDRAGYCNMFRIEGDRLVCDLFLFDACPGRTLLLEVAERTPELIGLSLDFKYTVELGGDVAFVRIEAIHAVDIVDEGAVTPRGLFSSKLNAGEEGKQKMPNDTKPAAEAAPAKNEAGDMLAKLESLCSKFEAFFSKMESIKKEPDGKEESKPAGEQHVEPDGDESESELKAAVKKLQADQTELRKTFSALGVKPAEAPKTSSDSAAEPVKPTDAKPETACAKFSAKVAELKSQKLSAAIAHQRAASENPELYAASLKERGIVK